MEILTPKNGQTCQFTFITEKTTKILGKLAKKIELKEIEYINDNKEEKE